jgi:hypothetical protein
LKVDLSFQWPVSYITSSRKKRGSRKREVEIARAVNAGDGAQERGLVKNKEKLANDRSGPGEVPDRVFHCNCPSKNVLSAASP